MVVRVFSVSKGLSTSDFRDAELLLWLVLHDVCLPFIPGHRKFREGPHVDACP